MIFNHLIQFLVLVLSLLIIGLFLLSKQHYYFSVSFSTSSTHSLSQSYRTQSRVVADNKINFSNVEALFSNRSGNKNIKFVFFKLLQNFLLEFLIETIRHCCVLFFIVDFLIKNLLQKLVVFNLIFLFKISFGDFLTKKNLRSYLHYIFQGFFECIDIQSALCKNNDLWLQFLCQRSAVEFL